MAEIIYTPAAIFSGVNKIIVAVNEGFHEIYVDGKYCKSALPHQTVEITKVRSKPLTPGEHLVSVYVAGRFVNLNEPVIVLDDQPEGEE